MNEQKSLNIMLKNAVTYILLVLENDNNEQENQW